MQNEKYIRFEDLPLRAKDGKLIQVEFVSNVYFAGTEKIIQCNIRDMTDRMQAENFLQSVQDALSSHIAILDHEGNVVHVNSAWSDYGAQNGLRHSNHCIGMNYLDVCDSATGKDAEQAVLVAGAIRAVYSGMQYETLVEYPSYSSNKKSWFVARITSFENNGRTWIVVAHENITERKHAENQVRQLNMDLEKRVQEPKSTIRLLIQSFVEKF